jgi:hypothetical protein
MRRALQGVLLSLMLAAGARAEAQQEPFGAAFGSKGRFAVSAERLFGYVHVAQTQNGSDANAPSGTTTTNSYSLLGTSINSVASVFTFPRVAFDAFVTPGLSVGAAVTYFHLASSNDFAFGGPPNTLSTTTISGYLLAPRVGYALRVGRTVWVWPRAGITYASFSNSGTFGTASAPPNSTSTNSTRVAAITVEAPVAIALGSQAVILVGPTVDIGISGTIKSGGTSGGVTNTSTSSSAKESDVGLQAGLALSF